MKRFSLCLLLFTVLLTQSATPVENDPNDRWLSTDKLQHLVVSIHLTLLSYKIAHQSYHNTPAISRMESAGLVLSIGLGKEFRDSRKPSGKFSYKDLAADALGIALGLIIGHNLK